MRMHCYCHCHCHCHCKKSSLGCVQQGMVWVELKVLTASTCQERMAAAETELAEKFQKVQRKRPHIKAILLLVTRVAKTSRTQWGNPRILAKPFSPYTGQWQDVSASGVRVGKGQMADSRKPPLSLLWSKIEFHTVGGKFMGLFKHFLQALGLPSDSPAKRASSLNKALRKQGVRQKLVQRKIPNRPGKPVWLGTKKVLRTLHMKVV